MMILGWDIRSRFTADRRTYGLPHRFTGRGLILKVWVTIQCPKLDDCRGMLKQIEGLLEYVPSSFHGKSKQYHPYGRKQSV